MKPDKQLPIRIAVPTNDGINIFPGMLGMAKYFFVYELKNIKQPKLIEKRVNPFAQTRQHLKTLDVYRVIADCSIIVAAHIGKKGITRLEQRDIRLFFKKGSIQAALRAVIKDL